MVNPYDVLQKDFVTPGQDENLVGVVGELSEVQNEVKLPSINHIQPIVISQAQVLYAEQQPVILKRDSVRLKSARPQSPVAQTTLEKIKIGQYVHGPFNNNNYVGEAEN